MRATSSGDGLAQDMVDLSAFLRSVVQRLQPDGAAEALGLLEGACRARRSGDADAPDLPTLLQRVSSIPLEQAETIVRALTLHFLLLNTAEQVDRLRHRRDGDHHSAGRFDETLASLQREGRSAGEVRARIAKLDVRPVLTAHPTEATRKTLLAQQSRIAEALLARSLAAPDEREGLDAALEAEVELMWLTAEVVRARPSVRHEVSTALWYLEDRLLDAAAALHEVVDRSFEAVFGEPLGVHPHITLGSWVAGDRDGNPFVTPHETLSATRRASHAIVRHYRRQVEGLMERLSLSNTVSPAPPALWTSLDEDRARLPAVWSSKGRWYEDEPLRLKLAFMVERLRRTEGRFEARVRGHVVEAEGAYDDADALRADLELVTQTLEASGATRSCRALVSPLRARVRLSGFGGFRLDVRQHSEVHTAALDAITTRAGLPPLDSAGLRQELLGCRPLLSPRVRLDDESIERTREVFRTVAKVQQESGESAASTYVISMTRSADDLLRVLLLGREEGLVDLASGSPRSSFDVVPLFETGADLAVAPQVMGELFADPVYGRQIEARGRRQEVMIGYSDSGKDIGLLPAAWSLYQAQERLTEVAVAAGVELTLFHGLGGTVGRGGGSPVVRALAALPPNTLRTGIKSTEQGEVISQKYGIPALAERSLEVMYSGSVGASMRDWREGVPQATMARFAETMDALASVNMPEYRSLVHDGDALFRLFLEATPVRELAHVHFGSRPVYRDSGSENMSGIRAIPWTFGWTQMRLMLPVWLGLGTALESILERPGGVETLREMAERWPFFDDLLAKVEMVMAKADLEIAGLYVSHLGGDPALFSTLCEEFERTRRGLLKVRGRGALVADPTLTAVLELRAPVLDALTLFQVHLLQTKRACGADDPRLARIDAVLGSTLSGIAQGLRNTG